MSFRVFRGFIAFSSLWKLLVPLILVLFLALLLRHFELGTTVLAVQEAFSWRLTSYPSAEVVQRTAADVHPPLYYLLLKAWVLLCGDSPGALRSFSVVFGIL